MPEPQMTILRRITFGYIVFISVWLLLRLIVFDRYWPFALVNTFAEYLFVPLPVLAIIVIAVKQWRLLAGLAVPAAAFAVMFGEFFLPSFSAAPVGQPLRAMTFNVLWENKDIEAMAAAIKQNVPDIIGFEEMHTYHYEGVNAALKADYPYFAPEPETLSGGVGLLSRYPIESFEPFKLPPRNLTLHAVVNVNGTRVHVFVVHLSPNNFFGYPVNEWLGLFEERYASRASETSQLKALIGPITEPVIMLCDCNLADTSQAYETLRSFLTDSHREIGWGFGHSLIHPPNTFRTQRLDYVWHNAAFAATSITVGPQGGSDHLPVTASLTLMDQ
jgi:vancomycin resistance protein VanJ